METRGQDRSNLVSDGKLVALFQVRLELADVSEAFVGRHLVEPFHELWVRLGVEVLLFVTQGLRLLLGHIFGGLLDGNATAARITLVIGRFGVLVLGVW